MGVHWPLIIQRNDRIWIRIRFIDLLHQWFASISDNVESVNGHWMMLPMPLFDLVRLAPCSLLLLREILPSRIHLISLILFIDSLKVLVALSRLSIPMNIGLLKSSIFRHHHCHDGFLCQGMIWVHIGTWLWVLILLHQLPIPSIPREHQLASLLVTVSGQHQLRRFLLPLRVRIIDLITLRLKQMRVIHLYLMPAMPFVLLRYFMISGLNRVHDLFMHHKFITYAFVFLFGWFVLC